MSAEARAEEKGRAAIRFRAAFTVFLINLTGAAALVLYYSLIDNAAITDLGLAGRPEVFLVPLFAPAFAFIVAFRYVGPIFEYLAVLQKPGFTPLAEEEGGGWIIQIRRKALRFPLVASAGSLLGWTLMGVLIAGALWYLGRGLSEAPAAANVPGGAEGLLSEQFYLAGSSLKLQWTYLVQSVKITGVMLLLGAVVSALNFFLIESRWQKQMPRFFPGGKLSAVGDRWIIPVRWRLTVIFLLVGAAPLILFGFLSYQRIKRLLYLSPEEVLGNLLVFNLFMVAAGVMLAVVLSRFVARSVSDPLDKLREAMERVKQGYLYLQVPVRANDELGRVTEGFNDMVKALSEKESSLTEMTQGLEEKVHERTRELEAAMDEKERTQAQLIQSEKMASLGQLVAGVAHEINNPIGYIYANTEHLDRYLEKFKKAAADHNSGDLSASAEKMKNLIESTREGAKRAKEIVAGLRAFSRKGVYSHQQANIHDSIEVALMLLAHEFKRGVKLTREYADLPLIDLNPGEMSQVFLNIIGNALQAVKDDGEITVRTSLEDEQAVVAVIDNGSGIAPENLSRIFEPFFTTKGVGSGTGLGLSISYGIVKSHGGAIEVRSEPGKGTVMEVRLPLKAQGGTNEE